MTESFAVPHQETEEEVSMDMEYAMRIGELQKKVCTWRGGGGGKALTMTPWNLTHDHCPLTSWNLPHGQWSKWLFCGQTSWSKLRLANLTIEKSYFGHGHGQNGYFCG